MRLFRYCCVFRLTCLKAYQGGSQKVPNKRQIDETPPPYTIQPDMAVPPPRTQSVSGLHRLKGGSAVLTLPPVMRSTQVLEQQY